MYKERELLKVLSKYVQHSKILNTQPLAALPVAISLVIHHIWASQEYGRCYASYVLYCTIPL